MPVIGLGGGQRRATLRSIEMLAQAPLPTLHSLDPGSRSSRERACQPFHNFRPHPEEPERSEGVSKDGRESELAAMVRDGALRAPPHHEAERIRTRAKIAKNWKLHMLSG